MYTLASLNLAARIQFHGTRKDADGWEHRAATATFLCLTRYDELNRADFLEARGEYADAERIRAQAKADFPEVSFDWKQGLALTSPPDLLEVLARCCQDYLDAQSAGSFESFADCFGYDEDSRRAERVYLACLDHGPKLRALRLSDSQIADLAAFAASL